MIESAVVLTPLHYAFYLTGVIVILAVMVLKRIRLPSASPSCLSWASSALNLLPAAS